MTIKIKPDAGCKTCNGRGEYEENQAPFGSGMSWMESFTCDCVLDQIPDEDWDEIDFEIDDSEWGQQVAAADRAQELVDLDWELATGTFDDDTRDAMENRLFMLMKGSV